MGALREIFQNLPVIQNFTPEDPEQVSRRKAMQDAIFGRMQEKYEAKNKPLSELVPDPSVDSELINKVFGETGQMTPEMVSKLAQENPIPKSYRGLTQDQFKDISGGVENLARAKAYGAKEPAIDKEDRMEDRRIDREHRAETRAIDREKRQFDLRQSFIPPKVKSDYTVISNNIDLANNIKTGLESAISKGLDVTGILASPVNKFKEIIGTLPEEEQKIITDLRLNFADFVRERGGTAFTATEKEVFGPIMPELNKDEKTNLNRINRMLEIMESKRSSFLDQFPGMVGNNQQKSSQKFKSPMEVKQAAARKQITVDQGKEIVRTQFGFK